MVQRSAGGGGVGAFRRSFVLAVLAFLSAAPVASATLQRLQAIDAAALTFRSGDLVIFDGSRLQCLGVGPAGVPNKSGVVCFQGTGHRYAQGSEAVAVYEYEPGAVTTRSALAPAAGSEFRGIFAKTTIRRTLHVAFPGMAHLAATSLRCWYYSSQKLDKGHRAVACYTTDSNGPLPRKGGIFIDDRLAAFVDVDSERNTTLGAAQHHAG
jgi:hypothetical protein